MMAATGRIAAGRALGEAAAMQLPAAGIQARLLSATSNVPRTIPQSSSSSSSSESVPHSSSFIATQNAPSILLRNQMTLSAVTQRRYRSGGSDLAHRGPYADAGGRAPKAYKPPSQMGEYTGNKGRVATPLAQDPAEQWRKEGHVGEFMHENAGRLHSWDFRMGAYASKMIRNPVTGKMYPKGTFIVAPKKDPVSWVLCGMMTVILVYNIAQLSWGETYADRRRFMVSERIRKEFGLPPGWDEDVLEDGDDEWVDRLDFLEEEQPRSKAK